MRPCLRQVSMPNWSRQALLKGPGILSKPQVRTVSLQIVIAKVCSASHQPLASAQVLLPNLP